MQMVADTVPLPSVGARKTGITTASPVMSSSHPSDLCDGSAPYLTWPNYMLLSTSCQPLKDDRRSLDPSTNLHVSLVRNGVGV